MGFLLEQVRTFSALLVPTRHLHSGPSGLWCVSRVLVAGMAFPDVRLGLQPPRLRSLLGQALNGAYCGAYCGVVPCHASRGSAANAAANAGMRRTSTTAQASRPVKKAPSQATATKSLRPASKPRKAKDEPAANQAVEEGDSEARAFAAALARAADSTKAQDIIVYDVAPLVSWTDYLVVCNVLSKPQLLAVLARLDKAAVEDFGLAKNNSPGASVGSAPCLCHRRIAD